MAFPRSPNSGPLGDRKAFGSACEALLEFIVRVFFGEIAIF
jgi:hypothetical protein